MSLYDSLMEMVLDEGLFDNIKKRKAEKERLQKEAGDRTLLEILNKTLKFVKSPFTLGDGYDVEIITILHHLGMNSNNLGLFLSKNKGSLNKVKLDDWFYHDKQKLSSSDIKKINNSLSFLENDDYIAFVSLVDNKLYHNWNEGKSSIGPYKFESLIVGDWEDYKEISDKNGDILGQINKIIIKYK